MLMLIPVVAVGLLPASGSAAGSRPRHKGAAAHLLATMANPNIGSGGFFGNSVGISGTTAVVGDFRSDPNSNGTASVFVRNGSGWPTTPTVILDDPVTANAGDQFGNGVAISANTIVVGASWTNTQAGVAYVYEKQGSTWPEDPTVTLNDPGAAPFAQFGFSVATSRNVIVVGAPALNGGNGAAYIYVRSSSGWPTTPTATLLDPGLSNQEKVDWFGLAVAVSGNSVFVGSPGAAYPQLGTGVGAAYVYVGGASGWPTTPSVVLSRPRGSAGDRFGGSLAATGLTAVVGADGTDGGGDAYVFRRTASGWRSTPRVTMADPGHDATDGFGFSVAISGGTIAVGTPDASNSSGAAYLYFRRASGWPTTPSVSVIDPTVADNFPDEFGQSVGVSNSTVLIGAQETALYSGSAYIYRR
jgi:hypothetical protein